MCYHTDRYRRFRSTVPTDRRDLERWVPMATALAPLIEGAIERGSVVGGEVPASLHHSSVYFFSLALSAAKPEPPTDPQGSVANYCIAVDAMGALPSDSDARAEISTRLQRYTEFAKRLGESRELGADEKETAQEVVDFFRRLAQSGRAQRYRRRVQPTDSQVDIGITA